MLLKWLVQPQMRSFHLDTNLTVVIVVSHILLIYLTVVVDWFSQVEYFSCL